MLLIRTLLASIGEVMSDTTVRDVTAEMIVASSERSAKNELDMYLRFWNSYNCMKRMFERSTCGSTMDSPLKMRLRKYYGLQRHSMRECPVVASVHLLGYCGQVMGMYCRLSFIISMGLVTTVDSSDAVVEESKMRNGCLWFS